MYDILLKNGVVMDGTGTRAYKADVAIADGKIAAVAESIDEGLASNVVDVTGLTVAPGFIDIHSHSDICFISDDRGEAKIYQGVTSELSGQCGGSVFPSLPEKFEALKTQVGNCRKGNFAAHSFEEFLEGVAKRGDRMGTNQLPLVGHGTLRAGVVGYEDRKATPEEMKKMRELLAADLKTGAWGMSLGLGYTPGLSADQDELCQLSLEIGPDGGIITSHMRDQGLGTPKSLEEMFNIYRYSGTHVHIAHFKATGAASHGKAPQWAAIVHRARANGVNVTADLYPYTASSSDITNSFPKWSIMGGKQRAMDAMTGEEKPRLMKELNETFSDAKAKTLLVVHTCGVFPEMDGKTLDQIAEAWSMSPADALVKLAYGTKTHAACISFGMSEEDVEYMLGQNEFSIGSDGSCLPLDPALNDGKPHPRNFGTFPRFLRLNREKGFCSPEQAIRRITGQSADYIGIKDRGYIRTGLVADITVLDMEKVTDKATYTDPFQKPEGIVHVLMDGQFAVKDGVQTEKRLGKILLRK